VLRELFVHDGHSGRIGRVGFAKSAAPDKAHSHGFEEIFVDSVGENSGFVLARWKLITFRHHRRCVSLWRHRDRRGKSNRPHARGRPRAFDELLVELLCLCIAVMHQARIEAHHQQVILAEALIARQLTTKTVIHKDRNGEQYQ
jgi:hypothetical protein